MSNKNYAVIIPSKNPRLTDKVPTLSGLTEESAISLAKRFRLMGTDSQVVDIKKRCFIEYDEYSKNSLDKLTDKVRENN